MCNGRRKDKIIEERTSNTWLELMRKTYLESKISLRKSNCAFQNEQQNLEMRESSPKKILFITYLVVHISHLKHKIETTCYQLIQNYSS